MAVLVRLASSFLLSCYGYHRPLHSFPTRRSSDLDAFGHSDVGEQKRNLFASFAPNFQRRNSVRRGDDSISVALKEDRKSTRLNSSHGYISYAVFCLKKKTSRVKVLRASPADWTRS